LAIDVLLKHSQPLLPIAAQLGAGVINLIPGVPPPASSLHAFVVQKSANYKGCITWRPGNEAKCHCKVQPRQYGAIDKRGKFKDTGEHVYRSTIW